MDGIKNALRFLFTTLVGTLLVGGVGLLFLCCGGAVMIAGITTKEEKAATKMTVAELEGGAAAPSSGWVYLSDGYLFWPGAKSLVQYRTKRGSEEKTGEKTSTVYVALVSQATRDEWLRAFDAGGRPTYSYAKCRAFLRLKPDQLKDHGVSESDLSDPVKARAAALKAVTLTGTLGTLGSEKDLVKDLQEKGRDFDAEKVKLLKVGDRPPTKGAVIGGGIVLLVFSLVFFVPLVVRLVRGEPRPRPARPVAGDWVRRAVDRGFERGVARGAGAAAAPTDPLPIEPLPAPPTTQFHILRNNQPVGPVTFEALQRMARQGQLRPEDLVVPVGGASWVAARTVAGLFG